MNLLSSLPRLGLLTVVGGLSASLSAADQVVIDTKEGARFIVAPYLLAANITGEVGIGRASGVPVEVDTGDIFEHLETGGMLHGEMWVRNWGVLGEVVFMTLSDTMTATGPLGATELTADAKLTEAVYELALAYRPLSGPLTVDVIAGIRVWDLSTEVDLSGALVENNITADETWVDPLVGARVDWRFADQWSLIGRGDLGGFGVGSEFAWNAAAYVGWSPATWCTLLLGYRAVSVDYDNETDGRGHFRYDVITHGGVLGAAFGF
jgi:hypothetical protein